MKTAIALGVLLVPALAFGHPVHGGGGGSGGGSTAPTRPPAPPGDGWDGPTATTLPAYQLADAAVEAVTRIHVAHCDETTDILGMRECTPFGTWSQNLRFPSVFIDTGMHVRSLPVMVYGSGMAQRASAMAAMGELRVGVDLPLHLYAAGEVELGSATAPDTGDLSALRTDGEMSTGSASGMFLGGYGVLGARFGTHAGLLALEAAAGARHVSGLITDASTGVVEARARAEVWLGPWITLGGTLGTSVLERGDWMTGVYVGLHSRAFAGGR